MKDIANGLLEIPRLLFGALRAVSRWLGTAPGRYASATGVGGVCLWTAWTIIGAAPPLSGGTLFAGLVIVLGALGVWGVLGGER